MTRSAGAAPHALTWLARLLFALVLFAPQGAWARDAPPLRGPVNDEADMLSAEAEAKLAQRLLAYQARTQQQFVLLTIDTLDGDPIEDFSLKTFHDVWKLGEKGKDNGLLLVIVKNDRKFRTEVGYGLEGDLTDAFTAKVTRNVLVPALRAGKAEQGIDQTFTLYMQKASGEAVPESAVAPPRQRQKRSASPVAVLGLLFLLLPFILPLLLGRGRGSRGAGFMIGGLGGFGGGFGSGGGGWGGGGGGGGGYSGGGGGGGGGGSSGEW